ncbi:Amidohydrolase family [Popillia japonica]|uniref:Amidohydrolase family n=1 Tax=Popillia japonica TaxID=7064 RepID=A0AAW1JX39_POPJA
MNDVERALQILEGSNTVLAFHAEFEENTNTSGDCNCYQTFLTSRPESMEINAIKSVIELSRQYNVRTHIVHLSTASALPLLKEAKLSNPNLSVETCYHYLTLNSENIPLNATQFKCCPPIRDSNNMDNLWDGLRNNIIDMVVSDHSPCTPELKLLNEGDFLKAWGGISSLQFGLSLFWTEGLTREISILDVKNKLCQIPAKLVGLHTRKGKIAKNYDADFVIWNPNATIYINESIIQHKNKVTPYLGKLLRGKVLKTIIRGEIVYEENKSFSAPTGKLLIN